MSSMDRHVLVLNQDYQPLSICSVQRSVKLLFLDKAELIHDDPDRQLRSVNDVFIYPSVIRLRRYINLPYTRIVLTDRNVMKGDRHLCQYCGPRVVLTLDHGVPRRRGRRDSLEDLLTACNKCNVHEGNRTPEAH